MSEMDRIHAKLARNYNHQAGVTNEFPSKGTAKEEWRSIFIKAGYIKHRNNEWHKPGHSVVIDPY